MQQLKICLLGLEIVNWFGEIISSKNAWHTITFRHTNLICFSLIYQHRKEKKYRGMKTRGVSVLSNCGIRCVLVVNTFHALITHYPNVVQMCSGSLTLDVKARPEWLLLRTPCKTDKPMVKKFCTSKKLCPKLSGMTVGFFLRMAVTQAHSSQVSHSS